MASSVHFRKTETLRSGHTDTRLKEFGSCLVNPLQLSSSRVGWLVVLVRSFVWVVESMHGDVNPVTAGCATAYQTLNLTSKFLVYENVDKRIHCGIAWHKNDRNYIDDIAIVLWRNVVVEHINELVGHPAQSIDDTHSKNHLGDSFSYFHHTLKKIGKINEEHNRIHFSLPSYLVGHEMWKSG